MAELVPYRRRHILRVLAHLCGIAALLVVMVSPLEGQNVPPEWTRPQTPFRIFGNTYYVGTRGLSSVLITSDAGHVLIDGALSNSAPAIADHIRAVGFSVADVELIVNSHIHYDHAGGISALQRASRARVAASPASANVLKSGASAPDDPQYGLALPIERIRIVKVIDDGEVLRVGPLAVQAHFTGGHTPGGTSWSWKSCEGSTCVDFVYADSLTPVSADGFLFGRSKTYPRAVADFEKSFAFLRETPCDILLTPHPDASGLWERVSRWVAGENDALAEPGQCVRYADRAEAQLRTRLQREEASGSPK